MIQLHDKYFEPYILQPALQQRIAVLGNKISADHKAGSLYLLVVLSGAYRFAAALSESIDTDMELGFIKLSSYLGMSASGKIKMEMGIPGLKDKDVVIVEDIIDTGATVAHILAQPEMKSARSVKIASLLCKPDAMQHKLNIDYLGFNIPDKFVVGFGLDYNGLGRNLDHIYQLKEN